MKKLLVVILFITITLSACEKEGTPTPSGPVNAQIENPLNGESLLVNIAVKIQISATSYTGIDEFQLWIDGVQVLSTVPQITGSGYKGLTVFYEEFFWTPTQTGTHTIKFVAIEGSGQGMDEDEIEVIVGYPLIEEGDGPPPLAPTPTKQRKQPTNTPPRAVPPPTSTPARKLLPTPTPTPGRG